jgi:hypothetical protein
MQELQGLSVNWAEVKKILGDVIVALESVYNLLPPGLVKSILGGVIASLNLIVSLLPNSESANEKK